MVLHYQIKKQGFTLVELLITIGIIGILATVTAVSIGNARAKARDSKRLTEVKQIQNALTLYQNENQAFPDSGGNTLTLGNGAGEYALLCNTASGFQKTKEECGDAQVFIGTMPGDPLGNDPYFYKYKSDSNNLNTYLMTFSLEAGTGNLQKGVYEVTPAGIRAAGAQ
ncbi:prepilin-type N-terminal cleavage/methylation domain-containing protein [Candidatus Uhrbacteria bacterium]|nr:prepilin-type N-terminal cleavage/methylation domain-containing protein [Candidatus Uhrbacteria bacterium]